jgi:hypothetical protein
MTRYRERVVGIGEGIMERDERSKRKPITVIGEP